MKDPYYRLLAAYPRSYRRERGRELVDMYREIEGDRRPGPREAADLILGGIGERLRRAGLGGAIGAVPAASVFALTALAGLATYYMLAFELRAEPGETFGRFASVYACAYLGWLVTAVIAAIRPGRPARIAAGVSLAMIVAALVLRFFHTPWPTLNLYMGLPLAVLGVMALALPASASRVARLAPIAAVAVVGIGWVLQPPIASPNKFMGGGIFWRPDPEMYGVCCNYPPASSWAQILAALGLLVAGAVGAILSARRGSRQGAWTLVLIATPAAALLETWLAVSDPVMSFVDRLTGLDELHMVLGGLVGMAFTAIGLPLAISLLSVGSRVYAIRRRPHP